MMSTENLFWRILRKIPLFLHKVNIRRKTGNTNVTIISQNCIGGVIYALLGQEFLSPTIDMFIEDDNFVKLAKNPEHYLKVPATRLTDMYVDPVDTKICYPKIKIDDIEICCLHYKDCDDAIAAWERRRKRINLKRVLVIANSWNMHGNEELIKEVCENKKYKTICFTAEPYPYEGCVYLKDLFWHLDERGIIRPDITDFKGLSYKRLFEYYIDIVDLINSV